MRYFNSITSCGLINCDRPKWEYSDIVGVNKVIPFADVAAGRPFMAFRKSQNYLFTLGHGTDERWMAKELFTFANAFNWWHCCVRWRWQMICGEFSHILIKFDYLLCPLSLLLSLVPVLGAKSYSIQLNSLKCRMKNNTRQTLSMQSTIL